MIWETVDKTRATLHCPRLPKRFRLVRLGLGIPHFQRGKSGCSLKEKISFLKSSDVLKKGLFFESESGFLIFLPEILCSLEKMSSIKIGNLGTYILTYRVKTLKIETVPPKSGRMISLAVFTSLTKQLENFCK